MGRDFTRLVPDHPERSKRAESIKARLEALAGRFTRNAGEPVWDCPSCGDGEGYVVTTDPKAIAWSRPCPDCEKGQAIIRGDKLRRARREAKAARDAAKAVERGEDLPI